jgi:hypothetical protein
MLINVKQVIRDLIAAGIEESVCMEHHSEILDILDSMKEFIMQEPDLTVVDGIWNHVAFCIIYACCGPNMAMCNKVYTNLLSVLTEQAVVDAIVKQHLIEG